jgi:hypothetical protein
MTQSTTAALQPEFQIAFDPPDLSDWTKGNTGIPGVTSLASGKPGPHVALLALTHGNEYSGAIALNRLLRAKFTPAVGRLTVAFVNLTAFGRFDPHNPTASRFIDEDLNRVWDEAVLDGPRRSIELDRARELRPVIDTVDVLLDLHSMLWPSCPLNLCGSADKGRRLAQGIGAPSLIVADHGHLNGRRIIDYARFSDPETLYVANLVEAGQHWAGATVANALDSISGLLWHLGLAGPQHTMLPRPDGVQLKCAVVTETVTAMTSNFNFMQPYQGGDVIRERNTLIARDGEVEIRTPYDNCLLVMPSLRPSKGHTAVRLGKFENAGR